MTLYAQQTLFINRTAKNQKQKKQLSQWRQTSETHVRAGNSCAYLLRMLCAKMLYLPCSQVQSSLGDGYIQGGTKHAALDVAWHVVIPLICMYPWS